MSATTAPTLNLVANGIRTSLSRVFSSKSPHPFLPLPSGSVKILHLSSSFTPSTLLFLEPKRCSSRGSPLIPLVAQTSEVGFEWEGEQIESGAEEDVEGGEDGDSYPVPSEEAKIFVGNLPYDVEGADLAELFNKAGVVETAEVIYNRDTDQSRGFGFVTMSTVEEADKAVEMFQRYDINGRLLTVNKAAPRGSRVERSPREFEPAFRIYVGNLSWGVDDSRLEQVFSEHGNVVEARVVYDRESGRSRGFGFVKMSSQIELDDAIAALDGQSLDGRAIRVNVAEERPRRGSF